MKFVNSIVEVAVTIIGNLFYFFSLFIPKNDKIWIFGGLLGKGYNDNSKYFFEYVNKTKKHIHPVWLSQNPKVVSELRSMGYAAYPGYSLKGCWAAMRAGVAVISHSRVRDVKPFVITSKVRFIQLWHGIPLKKIEFDDTTFFNKPTLLNRLIFLIMRIISPAFRREFDLFIACSTEDKKNFATAFRLSKDKIKITGYPRNDVIVSAPQKQTVQNIEKKILYVPTFRGQEDSNFDLFKKFQFDCYKIDAFLKNNNMQLYIKLHPYNKPSGKFLEEILSTENIIFYDQTDIYSTLNSFDILITDFSSIYFDFLLLDKPIIFAPFDMAGYFELDRELYYNYDDVTPGPKAENWNDILKHLALFSHPPDAYADLRQMIKERFHSFQDCGACERVHKQIEELL